MAKLYHPSKIGRPRGYQHRMSGKIPCQGVREKYRLCRSWVSENIGRDTASVLWGFLVHQNEGCRSHLFYTKQNPGHMFSHMDRG